MNDQLRWNLITPEGSGSIWVWFGFHSQVLQGHLKDDQEELGVDQEQA